MTTEKNKKIILVHSYKGGTGKTSVAINLARYLSIHHKYKVLLIEQDTGGSSFSNIFKIKPRHTWNDFYNTGLEIRDLITHLADFDVICSRSEEIEIPVGQNPKEFYARQLERLNIQKKWLKITYDYIILDTHPGYSYELLNSLFIADMTILLTRLDVDAVSNTIDMYTQIYSHFTNKRMIIVQNQVPILEIENYNQIDLDKDVEEALTKWNSFIKNKVLITIPLDIEIAYRFLEVRFYPWIINSWSILEV